MSSIFLNFTIPTDDWEYIGYELAANGMSYRTYQAKKKNPQPPGYITGGTRRGSEGDAGPRDYKLSITLIEQDGVLVDTPAGGFEYKRFQEYEGDLVLPTGWPEVGDYLYAMELTGKNSHEGSGGEDLIAIRPLQDKTPPLLTLRDKTGFNGHPKLLEIDLFDEIGTISSDSPLGTFTQNCGNVSGLQICIEEVNVYANAITGTIEFGSNKWRKYDQNSTDPNVDWFRFMLYEDDILIYTSHNFNPGGFAIDYSSSASNIFSGKYQFTVYPSTTLEPDKEYKIRVDGRDYDNFSTNEEVTVSTVGGTITKQMGRLSVELDGTVLSSNIKIFPYNLSIPAGGYHTVKVIGYDAFDNASGALTYKFNSDNWNGDSLQTFKLFEITSSGGDTGNAVSYVNLYDNSLTLVPKTISEILGTTTYDSLADTGHTWNIPDSSSGGLYYYETPSGGSSSNTIFLGANQLVGADYESIKFLKGEQNRTKNMNLFIGIADPTSVLTVEEKCVVPNPNLINFSVLSPAQDSSGIYNFYNPISIEYDLATINVSGVSDAYVNYQYCKITFDYSSEKIITQINTETLSQIVFTPDANDTIATIDFFNSCGEKETRILNIKYFDINTSGNPSDPISGTTVGSGSTPIGQFTSTGTTPNYHNLIIVR